MIQGRIRAPVRGLRAAAFALLLAAGSMGEARAAGQQTAPIMDSPPTVRTECCVFEPVGLNDSQIRFIAATADARAARARRALGLPGFGAPVRVFLAAGREEMASTARHGHRVAPWMAGVAYPSERTVAVHLSHFAASDLRTTLDHELLHVYVVEAANHRPLPRWFQEGVAMLLADEDARLHVETVLASAPGGGLASLADITSSFPAEGPAVHRAYAVSHAFLRWATAGLGAGSSVQRILALVGAGVGFDEAFSTVLGASPSAMEGRWRATFSHGLWLPFALHLTDILWFASALLLLIAIFTTFRKRRRALARMEREEASLEVHSARRQLRVIDGGFRDEEDDDDDDRVTNLVH